MKPTLCMAIVASLAGVAVAGRTNTVSDASGMLAEYNSVYGGADANRVNWHTGLAGSGSIVADSSTMSAGFVFSSLGSAVNPALNGGFTVSVNSSDGGNFYYGDTDTLRNVDFNAGDDPRPEHNSLAIAFGNRIWESNELIMTIAPGVTAFGFSYEDIGDVGGTLEVLFSDGTSEVVTTSDGRAERDGFMWAVASMGSTIDSIKLTQTYPGSDPNDGYIFYDFATVQVVPLPAGALAGLGLLGGMGVARRIRKRG